ncbi:DUF3310 domain-containing protein [Rubellimicrobium aerolatum]|uniref:DUF3310 domain-containing protein n=1 Tax=Rubellimicrobium aerolatum TaxID=490979 RepID=A0ABW0SF12_9RHOB|nr:DUF3310 domain-containing protein [Rubellimicrobium aerolatum]MBP1806478.1 hypothetical protein [Rubellimicrobium aerolatum]
MIHATPVPAEAGPVFRSARAGAADPVTRPGHYTSRSVECIAMTEAMGFCLGNAVKYLWRAGLKGAAAPDLRKAAWYVAREHERRLWGRPGPQGRTERDHARFDGVLAEFQGAVAEVIRLLWWADIDGGTVRLLEEAHARLAGMIADAEGRS